MIRRAALQALEQVQQILKAFEALPPPEADALYVEAAAGRHLRHVFDHYHALRAGLESGCIDYNERRRESAEESCRKAASAQLEALVLWVLSAEIGNRAVTILSEVDCDETASMAFDSNLHRELLYVFNHSIHHAAHIRLALQQRGMTLPGNIGIAPCTATWHRQLDGTEAPCAP